jgi:DNA polymerase-1
VPTRGGVTHTPFDVLAVWSALGIPLGQRVADTHLLSKLLDPDERAGHGLKELSARHLDAGLTEAETALHARMRALAPAGHRAGNAPLRWGWDHLPADDEAYVAYAGPGPPLTATPTPTDLGRYWAQPAAVSREPP